MNRCHKCGWVWPEDRGRPGMKEFCPKCTAFLHCCKNCRHHDPKLHNQCRVPGTEMVADRAGMNHCDEFVFTSCEELTESDEKKDRARDTLAQLFGGERGQDKSETLAREFLGKPKPRTDPKKALDNLFGS